MVIAKVQITVFDLDHTLLKSNSSFEFGKYLYHQKKFPLRSLLLCLSDYLRHKWLGMSLQKLHARSFSRLFKGQLSVDFTPLVDHFLQKHFILMLYPPAVERLKVAKKRGDRIIILSSSPDFLVKEIARQFEVSEWKATCYQVDEQGRFNDIDQVMQGEEKAQYVRALLNTMNLSFSDLTVYSDSILDLPLLKIAGHPVGVRPDWKLKRLCLENGWEILKR